MKITVIKKSIAISNANVPKTLNTIIDMSDLDGKNAIPIIQNVSSNQNYYANIVQDGYAREWVMTTSVAQTYFINFYVIN